MRASIRKSAFAFACVHNVHFDPAVTGTRLALHRARPAHGLRTNGPPSVHLAEDSPMVLVAILSWLQSFLGEGGKHACQSSTREVAGPAGCSRPGRRVYRAVVESRADRPVVRRVRLVVASHQ